MVDGSSDATALLGMEGFVVRSMELIDGEWWLLVETTADIVGCASCGVRAVGHGRNRVQVRDVPIAGHPVRLVWMKRRWRCRDLDCPVKTFTEQPELVEGCLTRRARREICRSYNQNLWMHHLTEGAAYLPL